MRFRIAAIAFISIISSFPLLAQTLEAREAFQEGYKLFEAEKYYSSIENFKLALQDHSYPLLDYCYYYIAEAYYKKNNFEEASQVYEIAADYYKSSVWQPNAMLGIGQCQRELKNYEASNTALYKLISLYPNHEIIPQARYLLGLNLEETGKYADAARVYQNIDLLHPDSYFAETALDRLDQLAKKTSLAGYEAPAATIYNLGVKYFQAGNMNKAKGYFTRLTKFYKKSSFYDEAIIMLGRIALRKGKISGAVQYFKKAINLARASKPEAMFYLARSYGYMDSPQAAINTLEKIAVTYPNSHSADEALYYIGYYAKQISEQDKALAAYEKLIASYPDSEYYDDAVWMVANRYFKQGQYEEAYQKLREVQKNLSERILFWSAKCAEKSGRSEEAVKYYKLTIQKFDHSYYAYRAREELKKHGIEIKIAAVPDVKEIIEEINNSSVDTADHEIKYKELLALDLGDEAAREAELLEEKVPAPKKEKASIAKYHAYVMKAKYAKPIHYADKKLNEATERGALDQVDPRLWRFSYPRGYWSYVEKYAKEYGLDPYLVYAVIREESRFKERALSRSWAHGLMQIIPSTGRKISRDLGMSYSRWKMYNPRVNIQMGSYYLATLIKRFDGNVSLALAGYNGGPVRVAKWKKQYQEFDIDEFVEDIPLTETRNYVKKVIKSYYGYKRTYGG